MEEQEKFYLYAEGEMHEVSEKVYRAYYKSQNHEEYLAKRDTTKVVSYNALDTETTTGESLMPDMEDSSPEDKALAKELVEQLHRCLALLPKAERDLIEAIYFEGMTETEYAGKVKMSTSGVSRRLGKILSKLRMFMDF